MDHERKETSGNFDEMTLMQGFYDHLNNGNNTNIRNSNTMDSLFGMQTSHNNSNMSEAMVHPQTAPASQHNAFGGMQQQHHHESSQSQRQSHFDNQSYAAPHSASGMFDHHHDPNFIKQENNQVWYFIFLCFFFVRFDLFLIKFI